ncbi:MAG: PhnD/SsuA/transferrin family substrate-binding protein [Alphaproteobacteria bacterium]|nr:PhnD/SsuA/transferrin family substrate-binding protein [Alphaproteobacteria bacterium]
MIASLFMYAPPELRPAVEAWWAGVAGHLRAAGLSDAPDRLVWPADPLAHWTDPDLLLAQACGYPLTHALAGRVAYVATPHYAAEGCRGPLYSSRIVARASEADRDLPAFRGRRLAYNDPSSQSGFWALRAALAARLGPATEAQGPFFAAALQTDGHRESLAAVREGRADLCAVDTVTWALLTRVAPQEIAPLAPIGWTPAAPGLPYITALAGAAGRLPAIRAGLEAAFTDAALSEVRAALLLDGFSVLPAGGYACVRAMERTAADGMPDHLFPSRQ